MASEQPSSWAAEPPASWYGSASTVSARSPGYVAWQQPAEFGRGGRELGEVLVPAGARGVPQRVGAEIAERGLGGDSPLLVQPQQLPCGGVEFGARVEYDRGEVEIDALQGGGQCGDGHSGRADGQPERGDPVLQVREHRLVAPQRIGPVVALAYVPAGDRAALGPAAPW